VNVRGRALALTVLAACAWASSASAELLYRGASEQAEDLCYRDRPIFTNPTPKHDDRLKAGRWLEQYSACVGFLSPQIAALQSQVQTAASGADPGASKAPAASLTSYQQALTEAQIDSHLAYGLIQNEFRNEFDYALWDHELQAGWSVLGGAGGALAQGPTLQYAIREHSPPGFKYTLSAGVERTSNLTWDVNQPVNADVVVRDSDHHWTIPLVGTASFGWTHSWFFAGAGPAWTVEQHQWAVVGRVGIAILENWLGSGDPNPLCRDQLSKDPPFKGEGELRFVVEPWIPIGQTGGPVTILFGAEVSAGAGWGRSAKCPYPNPP
jgi:hypothetical protein